MNTDIALHTAKEVLTPWVKATTIPEPHRLDFAIEATDLVAAVTALNTTRWGYLATITGLDFGPTAGEMELLYHFCSGEAVVTLRVRLSRLHPTVPSLCDRVPSASLFERELSEMLGVTVVGLTDTSPLYLPDNWPTGVYPMRKDYASATTPAPTES